MNRSARVLVPLLSLLAACDGASIVSRPRVDAAFADTVQLADTTAPGDATQARDGAAPDANADAAAPDAAPLDANVADAAADGAAGDVPVVVGEPAQNTTAWVSGSVFDALIGEPIAGASITVDGVASARSDADGLFSLTLPRGLHVVTVAVDGRIPFRREVIVGRAPTELAVPLLARAAPRPVDPAGTTLTLGDDGSITFPAGAVDAVTMVSATWVPPHALAALDPPLIDRGGGATGVPRAAVVVSDLATNGTVRLSLPRLADTLAAQLELRAVDADGNLTERLDPVSDGGGLVAFDVHHFSTYVLVQKRDPPPYLGGCDEATPMRWDGEVLSIRRPGTQIDLAAGNGRQYIDALCGDVSNTQRIALSGLKGVITAWTATARVSLTHDGGWRARFDAPLSDPRDQIAIQARSAGRVYAAVPLSDGVWEVAALDGCAAQINPLDCTGGARGLAITAVAVSLSSAAQVSVVSPTGATVIVQVDTEWRVCPAGSTPVGPPAVAAPLCRTPMGCPAMQRCDPETQRCVVDLDGACSATAPCARGLICQSARCVTPPEGPIACRTDVDCPDQRCNRGSRECAQPAQGFQQTCSGPRDCPPSNDCTRGGLCVYTTNRECADTRDCPVNSECYIGRCRPLETPPCTDTRTCPVNGSTCVAGICRVGNTCPAGETECGGRCTALNTLRDCGACGVVPPERPNARALCGAMGPTFRCVGGYSDCDGNAANGCETVLLANTTCGRCGNTCSGGTVCDAGRCVMATRSPISQLALGRAHGCARYANGRVRCWGSGPPGPKMSLGGVAGAPVDAGVGPVRQISSGADHVCALLSDATLWCWGRNDLRQLNDGTTVERATPTLAMRDVVEVAAGDEFTCARRTTGVVTCWGSNGDNQLGPSLSADGRFGTITAPGGSPIVQVAAGRAHACIRLMNGEAWCWGRNDEGQAGGTIGPGRAQLQRVATDVAELALGGNVSLLRRTDGTVLSWGNGAGITDGRFGVTRAVPGAVTLPGAAVQIAAGPLHACARLVDGRVMCWGRGDVARNAVPRSILPEMTVATQIALGAQNACATRTPDGAVFCVGSGDNGMMLPSGDGSAATTARAMPLF